MTRQAVRALVSCSWHGLLVGFCCAINRGSFLKRFRGRCNPGGSLVLGASSTARQDRTNLPGSTVARYLASCTHNPENHDSAPIARMSIPTTTESRVSRHDATASHDEIGSRYSVSRRPISFPGKVSADPAVYQGRIVHSPRMLG